MLELDILPSSPLVEIIQSKLSWKQCHTKKHLVIFAGNGCDIFNLLKSNETRKDIAKLGENEPLKN